MFAALDKCADWLKMQSTILVSGKQTTIRCWLMSLSPSCPCMSACNFFLFLILTFLSPSSIVPGRLWEGSQPAADPSVLWPGCIQRRAHGEAPGRLAEADPAGGREAHRDGRARGLQQDLQHPLLWGVHHHEPRGHRPLAAHRRDDGSLRALCGGAAAGGMRERTNQEKWKFVEYSTGYMSVFLFILCV